jgi:hypothetical protein
MVLGLSLGDEQAQEACTRRLGRVRIECATPLPEDQEMDQDLWAEQLLALKLTTPFRAFTITTGSDSRFLVSHPDEVELTDSCVEVDGPGFGFTGRTRQCLRVGQTYRWQSLPWRRFSSQA